MLFISGLAFLMAASAFAGEPAHPMRADLRLAAGRKIVNREVVPLAAGEILRAGETLYTWTSVAGLTDGFIEHVWTRDGVEVARHYLPVGLGRRWRTWSRHKISAGAYRVDVIGPHGEALGSLSFTVAGHTPGGI